MTGGIEAAQGEFVNCRIDGAVGHVQLTRPEKRNALCTQTADELDAALDALAGCGVTVATLTAAGPLFCAGADLGERITGTAPVERMVRRILDSDLLWVCGLNGGAAGAGVPLVLACPIVVAADDAALWLPELSRVGVFPVAVIRQLFPMIGARAALGLGASERRVDAASALTAGWIGEVVSAEDLEERVATLATQLAGVGADAVGAAVTMWRDHVRDTTS